jgi:hypothetical protein
MAISLYNVEVIQTTKVTDLMKPHISCVTQAAVAMMSQPYQQEWDLVFRIELTSLHSQTPE